MNSSIGTFADPFKPMAIGVPVHNRCCILRKFKNFKLKFSVGNSNFKLKASLPPNLYKILLKLYNQKNKTKNTF